MSGKVTVVTSGKGGVGKTTTTANMGAAFAKLGEKVLCIDVDMGLRNLDVIMGLESRVVFDLADVLAGRCRMEQAIIPDKRIEGLYLLPASQVHDKDVLDIEVFVSVVKGLLDSGGYDRILVDSPAGIESGYRTAAAPADSALVVVNPEVSSVRDADRIIGLLSAQGVTDIKLIINRLRPKMVASGDMLGYDDVMGILGCKMIGLIPEDEAILVSTNSGQPAVMGDSKAGRAFMDAARRVRGEDLPFPEMGQPQATGFFQSLMRFFRGGGN